LSSDINKALKGHDLFKDLPEDVVSGLAEKVEQIELKKDDVLFKEGDPGDAVYILREGWVKVVGEGLDGGQVVFNEMGPGSVFGEMSMVDMEPRSAGVVAISKAKLIKLGNEEFMKVMNEQPILAIYMTRNLVKRLRFATTYIENAIEWSQKIAKGEYNFAEEQMREVQSTMVMDTSKVDEQRANRFLSNFFEMVEDIKAREEELKQELQKLRVEIDQTKRKEAVDELKSSEFFQRLRAEKKSSKGKEEEQEEK
jgi:CRP-like cAMP-binding protein